jgi:hypothetical protein
MDIQELQNKIEQLERKFEELALWKMSRELQQLKEPLDQVSIDILKQFFMSIAASVEYEAGVAGRVFTTLQGKQGQYSFEVGSTSLFQYSVNTSTDFLISPDIQVPDGTRIVVVTGEGGTPPGGLSINTTYWLINSTGLTAQISTDGVTPINITSAGTGKQYFIVI